MNLDDVFVGCVACGIGLTALVAAIGNWEASFRLRAARLVEQRWGRTAARTAYALLGVTLITLGVAIALGFGPNKSPRVRAQAGCLTEPQSQVGWVAGSLSDPKPTKNGGVFRYASTSTSTANYRRSRSRSPDCCIARYTVAA